MATSASPVNESDKNTTLYNDVPYESYSYRKTHPDHLYTMGRLYGLTPPDFKTARVLEFGCAAGGNLLPFAHDYPESDCIGIDLSDEQVGEANKMKALSGVENIEFQCRDIMDLSKEKDGEFDYIICHGILSWVPEDVQQRIFELCRDILSPEGMAVISYNTLPGWHFVRPVRDMMLHYTKDLDGRKEKAQKAHEMIKFMAGNIKDDSEAYQVFLERERDLLAETFEDFVLHDHIGPFNFSFYLHDINDKLRAHNLQYVVDGDIVSEYIGDFSAEAQKRFSDTGDRLETLQLKDFLANQRFRTTILTRSETPVRDGFDLEYILEDCYFTLGATPQNIDDLDLAANPDQEIIYIDKNTPENNFKMNKRATNELLLEFYYQGLNRIDLKTAIENVLVALAETDEDKTTQPDEKSLREAALEQIPHLVGSGFINITPEESRNTPYISDKPKAHPLTRLQAELYTKASKLANADRDMVDTHPFANDVLSMLDGDRSLDDIQETLLAKLQNKEFNMNDTNGLPITDPVQQKMALQGMIFNTVTKLAETGFLVG